MTLTLDRPSASSDQRKRAGTLPGLCALYLLLCLPFIYKPFHTDEPVYVWIAEQIVRHPLDYYGFALNWEGHSQPVSQFNENPPLMPYLLAIASRWVGWSELGLRLAVLPVGVLTLIGSWSVARQFCSVPALVVATLLCCPAFFISSTSLMCEPLSLCLWVWTVFFWTAGSKGRASYLLIAGVLTAAAILSKYSSLCLLPLLIAHSLIYPTRAARRPIQLAALFIPVITTIAYEALSHHQYGSGAITGATGYASTAQGALHTPAVIRVLNTLAFIGGGAVAVSLLSLLLLNRWFSGCLLLLCSCLAALAAHSLLPPASWQTNHSFVLSFCFFVQYAMLLGLGLALALGCGLSLLSAWRRQQWRDELFLCLWIGGVVVFTAFFNWSINARSILPMILPASILVVRGLGRLDRFPKQRVRMIVAVAGLLTLAVTNADYQLASICRSAAGDLMRMAAVAAQAHPPDTASPMSPAVPSPPRLWFAGHSGFQYYMQAACANELDDQAPQFRTGEVAIFPLNSYGAAPGGQNFRFLAKVELGYPRWLATIQTSLGANFYCSYGYDLPYIFGPVPPESFLILQVTPQTRIHR